MDNKGDIPFHHYSETHKYENMSDGNPVLSIEPNFPFVFTQFDIMHGRAQTEFPHRHDYYEILFVEDGLGEYIIDYEPYEIKPPSFYFLSKGQIHFWQLKKTLTGKVLLFPREFLIPPAVGFNQDDDLLIFNSLSKAPYVSIDKACAPKIHELLSNINKEFLRKSDCSLSVLRAYVHILLVNLFRIYTKEQPTNIMDTTNTELTTAEIAYTLNFEDSSYFSRFFKRETGKGPSNYREEIRKKYQIAV